MHTRLGIPADQVAVLRDRYFHAYGTTLSGLMRHHAADPFDYLDFVHQVPIEDMLRPDPVLAQMLDRLPQQRVVFTNAAQAHAERVLSRLGIAHVIHEIIDIVRLDFVNKPSPEAFHKALGLCGETEPERTLVADDSLRNLETARSLGMTTVLVGRDDPDGVVDYHIARISELAGAVPGLDRPAAEGAAALES